MRVFRKIVVFVVVFFAILTVVSVILVRVFEDELTTYVVDGLNRQIRAEVNVGEVKLSFMRKFPDASLEFRDVFIASVPDFQTAVFPERNTDTLLSASHLFLRFNVLKLLKHQYLVREVQIQSGQLNIFIDRAGKGNYKIWDRKDVESEKKFLLELDNVNLADIIFRFDNRALEIDLWGNLRKSYFRGQFSRDDFAMSAGLDGILMRYSNEGTVFLKEQKISANTSLNIDPRSIRISEGKLIIAGQHVILSGEMMRPAPLDLDLVFEGKQLDMETILHHLVISSRKIPDNLRAGGNLDFTGKIKGTVSATQMPWIDADFILKDGWMNSPIFPEEVREIKTRGSYSNGIGMGPQTTLIQLNGMSMKIGNSRIGGDYSVYNLVRPDFNYQVKADLDLSDLQKLISRDSIFEVLQGRVLGEFNMKGDQALLKNFKKSDLLKYTYDADLHLENVSLKFRTLPLDFESFTGDAEFTDHLEVINLSGVLENSQVSMSGRVDNFLEYLLTPGGNLWMDVDLYSERMDLNYLRSMNARTDKINRSDSVFLPERLYLKTRFWFDELEINEFKARQITGNLIYKPKRLSINHIELLSMGGLIKSQGILEQQRDMHFLVKSMSEIKSVDITEAFSSFKNFGQDFIVDSNLNGSLTGTVNFSAGLDEKMQIKKNTILADCDVVIRDGELSGFEPMMKLSRFIDIEELESIKFSTLTNEIFIRNEEVLIPKMDISSTAADITASGIHSFDKNFTYKLKIALSELRSKRSSKLQEKESEFGEIEEDGLGQVYVYLIIEGTPEGTDVRYDRRGAMQNVREQMRDEKQEIKKLLNEELGWFRKDSTLRDESEDSTSLRDNKQNNNSDKERFIIVWDEDDPDEDTIPPEPKKRKRKKNK